MTNVYRVTYYKRCACTQRAVLVPTGKDGATYCCDCGRTWTLPMEPQTGRGEMPS